MSVNDIVDEHPDLQHEDIPAALNYAADMKVLDERVHPATGRTMIYVACDVMNGDARVADDDELAELAWSERQPRVCRLPARARMLLHVALEILVTKHNQPRSHSSHQ
jgi:hypothetical protein